MSFTHCATCGLTRPSRVEPIIIPIFNAVIVCSSSCFETKNLAKNPINNASPTSKDPLTVSVLPIHAILLLAQK
uniref:hypothetical protein n=1 Tax=Metasolibacillus sp. FSL K6-0083 TaxID=2921416 RepID=UPI00406C9F77